MHLILNIASKNKKNLDINKLIYYDNLHSRTIFLLNGKGRKKRNSRKTRDVIIVMSQRKKVLFERDCIIKFSKKAGVDKYGAIKILFILNNILGQKIA